jgi:proline iminopeptidase
VTLVKVLLLLAAATGAAIAGAVVTLLVAWVVEAPALFLAAGVVTALVVWLAACRALSPDPRPWQLSGAIVLAAALVAVLVPLRDPVVAPPTPPGAGVWTLPDGGLLAYGVVRAHAGVATATPVVVLHGGPGVPDLAGFLTALAPLAADGHDVWAYDQRGAGSSSRLADPSGYTTQRAVEDLEQVRLLVGSPRLVIVGHSYGAYVAAAYVAAHPDRVEKVIFSSPGDLDESGLGGRPQSRLNVGQRMRLYGLLASPRAMSTYALVQVNPAAAHALADDREVDARQDRVYAASLPALHCAGGNLRPLHALGFYANQVPQSWRRAAAPDVRQALSGTRIPVLVVKGQCDYLDWWSSTDYLDTFPGGVLSYVPGAGHEAYLDRPDLYVQTVRSFLAGAPIPGTLANPRRVPDDYQP